MSTTDTTSADGSVFSTEAYAAVEKAAKSRRALYVSSVLEHAAGLLTDLWAVGEKHGVALGDWAWTSGLADASVDVVARQYGTPDPERTPEETLALAQHLLEAMTSDEIGLNARIGPRVNVVLVKRGSDAPSGGIGGDADLAIGIWSNGGWDISLNRHGASVLSVVAPASRAGASQIAETVRALVHGELGDPFRSSR
ncbi:hypothetical protein ACFVZ4_30060 [Streptomyces goshikiensis]|uniref:hypothetical protein n=1 Tax=Streptomyces goshikiensis TaxID=1942 RepID=UPI00368720A0